MQNQHQLLLNKDNYSRPYTINFPQKIILLLKHSYITLQNHTVKTTNILFSSTNDMKEVSQFKYASYIQNDPSQLFGQTHKTLINLIFTGAQSLLQGMCVRRKKNTDHGQQKQFAIYFLQKFINQLPFLLKFQHLREYATYTLTYYQLRFLLLRVGRQENIPLLTNAYTKLPTCQSFTNKSIKQQNQRLIYLFIFIVKKSQNCVSITFFRIS
eukprot:TRINITY_DN1858_c0_g1_i14.p4 TRINITY_DN1858_c0_g1~~TRINITY_DN1858_c0_g1_i14.p4  ORF type:complete len:220 (+),score=-26.71 TRINITY_DN1858_c0_g1_i14:27-662(+)